MCSPEVRGRRSPRSRSSTARVGWRGPIPHPVELGEDRSDPPSGAVVVAHLEGQGGLAAVHRPGERPVLPRQRSLGDSRCRQVHDGDERLIRGQGPVETDQGDEVRAVPPGVPTHRPGALRTSRSPMRRSRPGATGPEQAAGTASSRVRRSAPAPRTLRQVAATSVVAPGRQCNWRARASPRRDVCRPARPGVVATSTLPAGGTSTIPWSARHRERGSRVAVAPATRRGRGRWSPVRLPLPTVAAVDVADLVDLTPVEIHDRARGGPDGGNGRLEPVARDFAAVKDPPARLPA